MVQADSKPQVIMMRAIQTLAPTFFQHQVAGHLEEDIADEEQPRPETVGGLAELQIAEHLQLGEADVDTVQISGKVAEAQERNELPGHFAVQLIRAVGSTAHGGAGSGYVRHCVSPGGDL
jgi:hypothetical protein